MNETDNYVTVDWDGVAPLRVTVKRLVSERLRNAGGAWNNRVWGAMVKDVWWRSSAHGHVHLLMRVDERMEWHTKLVFRALMGDDPLRLSWDCLRAPADAKTYGTGVLFDFKSGKKAGQWYRLKI